MRPIFLAACLIAASVATAQKAENFGPLNEIKKDDLKAHLEFIASDELEGRNTPSRGLDIAALYIAAQLKLHGAKPGGDNGTYFQTFMVPGEGGKKQPTQNVIGIFEGSDPVLKNEYVGFGCHYDHVGMAAQGADRVFNGADDNGSGTVTLLEFAQALSKGPKPKRSMILIWHAGEERGLWGSNHFVENPTIPLKQMVTMLNMDMIGRSFTPDMGDRFRTEVSGSHEIFVIGSKKMSTELGQISEETNRKFLGLDFNYKFDDPKDPQRLFYRSDHYEYARKGVPIIFYFDGIHPDYHQVTDEVKTIDFEKMEKVGRTIFATGWVLANRAQRVKVDRPLDGSTENR